jgi:CRISPR system Cascade subunit CasB
MSRLLERLRKCKDDRGMMANLRCILVDNKKHRAWPALNRLGVPIKENVAGFIAGLYATHPEESFTINFGATCKAIEQKRDDRRGDDNKLTPTERRFQHLLAADKEDELYARILRMVLMAKSQGIPVNYQQLEIDLKRLNDHNNTWSDRIKIEWAATFWAQGALSVPEDNP